MALNPLISPLSHQEILDIKRNSGKAPCAECKRLKLKCDKIIPCSSCVRRGCGHSCPNGTYLPTGRGRRTVPTELSRARRIFSEMEARMKELETAITRANHYHLDVCPYLGISPGDKDPSADQLADSFGSLSVNDTGNVQYYGPSARTEALLSIEVLDDLDVDEFPPTFTTMTDSFSVGFRGTTAWDPDHALLQLLAFLPVKSRARELVELYFQNGCWSGTPIMRDELIELLSLVYGDFGATDDSGAAFPPPCSVHQIAVIHGVFALAALVDLALPPYNAESEHYFDLCRAALSVSSVFDSPSLATIQALVLVSTFYSHGGSRFSMDGAWSVISLASSLSKSMDLHSGWVQPGLGSQQIQRRRALFWETYASETLISLVVGRPTGTYLASISCPFPVDDEKQTGSGIHKFYCRWEFIKQVAAPVLEAYLTTQPPGYDTTVDLDHRIRKFMHSALPPDNQHPTEDPGSPAVYTQHRAIPQACMIMLVYIHSHAFLRAIHENPDDPYYTSFATSFLSAYRYASELIRAYIDNFQYHPQLFSRWWPTWKNLFNAAIVVGAIAAKGPQIGYWSQALLELFVAIELFEGGAATCYRARAALNTLHKLRAKAISTYTKHSGGPSELEAAAQHADADATLDVFAGRTRVIAQTLIARDRAPKVSSVPPAVNTGTRAGTLNPALVEYFSSASPRPHFDGSGGVGGDEYSYPTADAPSYEYPHAENPPIDLALFDFGGPPSTDLATFAEDDYRKSYNTFQPFLDSQAHDPQWMSIIENSS
ncbi:hypothetical protein K438DRAFT_2026169 [Mycena galopus ATCC 62051]|nr:hypothetical protein K438DRAFT_2026169 [Mycena galopus ATCC 62051]